MTLLWEGNHLAKNYGLGTIQGVCAAVQLDRTVQLADRPSIRLAVDDADSDITQSENTPCGWNNRTGDACAAALIGYGGMKEGDDLWFRHAVYVPMSQPYYEGAPTRSGGVPGGPGYFPLMRADQRMGMMLWEWYGPPFGGAPGCSYSINTERRNDRNVVKFGHTLGSEAAWQTDLVYDDWMLFGTHIKFSIDPAVGFVEIEYNEYTQEFTDGSTRLHFATIAPSHAQGPQSFYTGMNYRQKGVTPGLLTVNFDSGAIVGTDHSDVNY